MANYTVSPFGLTFNKATVQGPLSSLYAAPQMLSFVLKNNTASSITITNYGFTLSTEGDAVTQPAGILHNSDFTVAVHSGSFPVTITAGSSQQFDVTYAPIRRGSGFGDIRSAMLVFYQGNKALSNGGSVFNSSGELVNETLPQLVTVGVGGGVLEEGYDWAATSPIFRGAGDPSAYVAPAGYGNNAPIGLSGVGANMTLADMDTSRHAVSAIELYSGTGNGHSTPATGIIVRARSVQVLVFGLDTAPTTSFDLEIDAYTNTGLVAVANYVGLNYKNVGGLFIGNHEGIDLQGMNLYAVLTNVVNPNNVTIKIGVVVTG